MRTICAEASKKYDIRIQRGLLSSCGPHLQEVLGPCRLALVTESNVEPLYGHTVRASLTAAGYAVETFVFEAGEASKSFATLERLLCFLAQKGFTRSDALVALGGGVCGDLTGLAAAVFLRGVAFVQLPTTFLAAIDSSVGGKTAVDLPEGKNLVGAFWQPSLVLIDCDAFLTLPPTVFADGMAEALKYGVLADEKLFLAIQALCGPADPALEAVVADCVSIKRDVVALDEYDRGTRRLLNLGHTLGHAVEKRSGFALRHGQAVAIGMAMVARAARRRGLCSPDCQLRIVGALKAAGLPTTTVYSDDEIFEGALSDKKRQGGTIAVILPERIGHCRVETLPVEALRELIAQGRED